MARDCQAPAAAGLRRPERAISAITMIRTSAPSTTHSQTSDDPEPLLAAGEVAGSAAFVVTGACALGAAAGLRLGRLTLGRLALGARLLIALLTVPPHPVTSNPAARAAPRATTNLARCRGIRAPRGSLCRKYQRARGKHDAGGNR